MGTDVVNELPCCPVKCVKLGHTYCMDIKLDPIQFLLFRRFVSYPIFATTMEGLQNRPQAGGHERSRGPWARASV